MFLIPQSYHLQVQVVSSLSTTLIVIASLHKKPLTAVLNASQTIGVARITWDTILLTQVSTQLRSHSKQQLFPSRFSLLTPPPQPRENSVICPMQWEISMNTLASRCRVTSPNAAMKLKGNALLTKTHSTPLDARTLTNTNSKVIIQLKHAIARISVQWTSLNSTTTVSALRSRLMTLMMILLEESTSRSTTRSVRCSAILFRDLLVSAWRKLSKSNEQMMHLHQ